MRNLLLALLLISAITCHAQNWQCLQPGVKGYFTNGYAYLRGIRIDSVKTLGDTMIYFPFHTPRGSYVNSLPTDSAGGSWLDKRVLKLNDGTFMFDNYWGDDVVTINTRANEGDHFLLYSNANDTNHFFYDAMVTSTDTMTIAGMTDSIKTMKIYVFCDTGYVPSDPVNGFEMILSKNNGFVHIFDLYTFPYHGPNKEYSNTGDFFLDQSTQGISQGDPRPTSSNAIFNRVTMNNPTEHELYNWNINDEFQFWHWVYSSSFSRVDYITATVIGIGHYGHNYNYTLSDGN